MSPVALKTLKRAYQDSAVAEQYDAVRFRSLAGRALNRLEKRTLVRLIRSLSRELDSKSALDAPCGTGRATEWLLAEGLTVTGVDISAEMLEVARERCARFGTSLTLGQDDLQRLRFDAGTFPLVTCIRLFHHLSSADRRRILIELSRVSSRFVIVNVALSTRYYRARRWLKRRLGLGVSASSSTWAQIREEARAAGLMVRTHRFVLPLASEDLFVLFERPQTRASACIREGTGVE